MVPLDEPAPAEPLAGRGSSAPRTPPRSTSGWRWLRARSCSLTTWWPSNGPCPRGPGPHLRRRRPGAGATKAPGSTATCSSSRTACCRPRSASRAQIRGHPLRAGGVRPSYPGHAGPGRGRRPVRGAVLRPDGAPPAGGPSRDDEPLFLDLDFVDGTRGAHVNISGISGWPPRPATPPSSSTRCSSRASSAPRPSTRRPGLQREG